MLFLLRRNRAHLHSLSEQWQEKQYENAYPKDDTINFQLCHYLRSHFPYISCVQLLQTLTFPFYWQNTFIFGWCYPCLIFNIGFYTIFLSSQPFDLIFESLKRRTTYYKCNESEKWKEMKFSRMEWNIMIEHISNKLYRRLSY